MKRLQDGFSLAELHDTAEMTVRQPGLGEEFEDAFDEAEQLYFEIRTDVSEWVNRFYRDEYRDWQAGERGAVCTCHNPRCGLKRGELPYQLRRRASAVREERREPEAVLQQFLREHPQAAVIDEALDALAEKRQQAAHEFRRIIREGDELVESGEVDIGV